MHDSNLNDPLSQHQQEYNDWLRKRRWCRLAFFVTIGIGIIAAAVVWRHTGMLHDVCAPPTHLCQRLTGIDAIKHYPFWVYWLVAASFGLNIAMGITLVIMLVVWTTSISHRLYLRGPMHDIERRKAFLGWLKPTIFVFVMLTVFTILEF